MRLSAAPLLFFFVACRTSVAPVPMVRKAFSFPKPTEETCQVFDFAFATDLPEGTKNIGWLKMPRQGSDEATFQALRKLICSQGGNAMTQPHWIRETNATLSDEPKELEANAWILP